jgi:Fe-S cluster biogenesis protein NfuA
MKVTSVQPTPNPNALKFVLDRRILSAGVRNYARAAEAAGDPLAAQLFAISGIETVFLCDNFVTISMLPSADWRGVHDAVVKLLDGYQGEMPTAGEVEAAPAPVSEADRALLEQINALLDDRVRPALAGDGGGLEVVGLHGKSLRIRYQGACGSCPSSIAGTLQAIQNLLQTEVDEALTVVPA